MKITITSLNINYEEGEVAGVQIHYNAQDEGRTVYVNGHLPLTNEEYAGNESIASMIGLIRADLVGKLSESVV